MVFQIDMARLKRTAASIAGLGISSRRFDSCLERVGALQVRSPRSRELLSVLTKAFSLLDHPELETLGALPHLPLDDLSIAPWPCCCARNWMGWGRKRPSR